MKPKHRLQISFDVQEGPVLPVNQKGPAWQKHPTPTHFYLDSSKAVCIPQDHFFEGRAPNATGHCWYSYIPFAPHGDPRHSLRVLWWEIVYEDGSEWVACWVGNESIEAPIGRLKGDLRAWIEGVGAFGTIATLGDQGGCAFTVAGKPQAWLHWPKYKFWHDQRPKVDALPLARWFEPQACPDAQGGAEWKPAWSPSVRTGATYAGLQVAMNGLEVPRWYERNTHSHYRETFRSLYETAWAAAAKADDKELAQKILDRLWEWSAAQAGCASPTGSGYIDGRPNHLAFLDGSLPRAATRYRLTATDRAAGKPFVLHEGRPELGKNGWQFTECFGRDKLHWLDSCGGRYQGQYLAPNGSDFEHGGHENLVAAALILGSPIAQRELHHICEEHVSQGIPKHSSRSTAGWFLKDLWLGYLVFEGNSVYGEDAERYRAHANAVAEWTWQNRYDLTPYQCLLGTNWEYYDHSIEEERAVFTEATMQLACALHASCFGAQLESDITARKLWHELVGFLAACLVQPGIIDWQRGGILARYSSQGPLAGTPGETRTVGKLLEATAPPAYNFRNVLGAEGWIGPALAHAARVTGDPEIRALAKDVWEHQRQVSKEHGAYKFLDAKSIDSWAHYHDSIVTFGWGS